jgi:hypothetical protein
MSLSEVGLKKPDRSLALVAGKNRVPRPAIGETAFLNIIFVTLVGFLV